MTSTNTPHDEDPIRTDEDGVAIYKLAFDEGLRRLEHQDSEVNVARTRLLQLLTVVTAATAFLGAAGLKSTLIDRSGAFYVFAVAGTGLYMILLVQAYLALQPLKGWIIETSPKVLIQDYADKTAQPGPASVAETYRSLALHYQTYAESNEHLLARLRQQLVRAIIIGGIQVVCWVIVAWLVG